MGTMTRIWPPQTRYICFHVRPHQILVTFFNFLGTQKLCSNYQFTLPPKFLIKFLFYASSKRISMAM